MHLFAYIPIEVLSKEILTYATQVLARSECNYKQHPESIAVRGQQVADVRD